MDCSIPGFPVHHYLPEFAQTHVHWVSDAIQPSHPLSSPSPPTFNLSQHQGLFQWVSSLPQMAKVLEFQLQSVLLMNIQGWFPLGWTGLVSLLSKELSRVFSRTTFWKHQFFGAQPSLWFNSHICTWWGKGQGGTNWEIGIDIYTLLCVTLFSFLYLVSHVGSACVSSRSVSLLWPQNVCV